MAKTFIPVFYHICGFWQGGKGIPFVDFTRSRRARIRERAVARARCGASCARKTLAGVSGVKQCKKNRKTALRRSHGVRGAVAGARARDETEVKRNSLHRCRWGGRQGGRCGERRNKGAHMRSLSADRTAVHSRQRGKRGRSKTPWHTSCENSVQGGILQYPYEGTSRSTSASTFMTTVVHAVMENVVPLT